MTTGETETPAEARPAGPPATPWARLYTWFTDQGGVDRRVAVTLTVAAVILILFRQLGSSAFFHSLGTSWEAHPRSATLGDLWWFASCFLLLGVLPALLVLVLPRLEGDEHGLGLGDWRFGLRWVAILYGAMLPIVAVASRFEAFWRYYPLSDQLSQESAGFFLRGAPSDWLIWFVAYEIGYALYFVGWEYFYRGFLTLFLLRPLGLSAIFVANVPFALMHAGKPSAEALGSIIAGLALGLFAIRARSFWYGWLLHALVAASMDLLALERRWELGGG